MPTPTRLFRTTAFKLSLAYLCVIVVLSLGLIAYISSTTARLFDRQLETAIDREIAELNAEYEASSLFKVMRTIGRRAMQPDASVYLVTDFSGNPLAGNVSELMYDPAVVSENVAFPVRYMRFKPGEGENNEEAHRALVKLSVLGGGYRLLVGRDVEDRIEFATIIRRSIRGAIIVVVGLGLLSWIFLSRSVLRKVDAVAASSQKIIGGDLARRLPVDGSGDEFDRLAHSVNAMLDEINRLHSGLQEVSQNIAHDLKTPLTRLRNRLDEAMRSPPAASRAPEILGPAIEECDHLIRTFEALLTIARVESNAAGVALARTDLSALLEDIAEFYDPAAEDAGMSLVAKIAPGVVIDGEPTLLRTMMANLLDNALKYGASPTGQVDLVLERTDAEATIVVRDFGTGVANEDLPRLTDRFVRMDAARTKPGAGLGLAMVKAVVGHHGGRLTLDDAGPGFRVSIALPLPA
ncbi:HAMP domain-containing sensor histidine kinase [Acuticoccus sp. MNP-M23]|uniref:sensor histidine kinase n=1 Tax=Acuticoccus sp. MNP-M23 TaxID=3072793 RepID=UPI002815F936|nr:HAMP domain-containing sensor histidine kinase [Acuticoccus sp. MNP-M23]WMS41651.1 HAMP domain-containing sensor histidine kinase [Acuticoccus sp. MNP-M23]